MPYNSLNHRNIVVSGVSKGIGLAIARLLVKQGCTVHGISRGECPTELTGSVQHYRADLQNAADCEKVAAEIRQQCSPDALVCNAGKGRFSMLEQYSVQQIQHELQLNLISHILITRALLPDLKKKPRSNIVFIGSESSLQGGRFGSIYSAAKFGIRGFAQALRHECSTNNCHVGIINPGMVRTSFFDELDFAPGQDSANALEADDVAAAVWHTLASPDHAVIDEINLNPLKRVVKKKQDNT